MSFRTLGWFGPACPFTPTVGTWEGMEMYDFSSETQLSQFPLDIAMKIFWEAQTITVDASVTFPLSGSSATRSGSITSAWGEFDRRGGTIGSQFNRPFFENAKSALCPIANSSGTHTYKEEIFSAVPVSSGFLIEFIIQRRPYFVNNKLIAPFFAALAVGVGVEIRTSPRSDVGTLMPNTCLWITPWGNVNSPLYRASGGASTTGSMTITVTAADPAARYA
jgi:hypothetical protein